MEDFQAMGGQTGLEEPMWELALGGGEQYYPERPGEPDCMYYMRTGSCGYGERCRYNHPRDRSAVVGLLRGGEYPERVDQPVCQYYMKTGFCKFGATCKYHHPNQGGGPSHPVPLNYYGFPLRPGEKECSYYVKTGQCKFGATCKFHHPQPSGIPMPTPVPAPQFYSPVQSPSVPSPHPPQYAAPGTSSWQVARPPLFTGSYVQGTYAPLLIPPIVQIPGWSVYPQSVSQTVSPNTPTAVGVAPSYNVPHQLSPSAPAYTGPFSHTSISAGPSSSGQKAHKFPERPGQAECQFYMRTGDCKYGSTCKYHHPPEWSIPQTNCVLSPMGLPIRPGTPPCTFYMQHGICKFGPTCKFDHPMGTLSYSPSASSLADMPVAPLPLGMSMATLAPSSSSSDLRLEYGSTSVRDSFPARIPSSDNTTSGSVGSIFSKDGMVSHSRVQLSIQSSASPGISISTGQIGGSS
ncbi:Zinc finger CCCH domain-containing protein 32 [Acorus gramineus]|uniref:Zinc finger CCCH domain-containing protein 32 n=1 Tax=Acorus gramineus TaxID=55184 RepID=A0AAV9BRD5_ACOGR|nr:Zinc finger CCCH domain-containing protein 32 [Acorus gramineus]